MAPLSENSYSPAEITAILLDFYLFLTTLHYDAYLGSSDMVGQVMKRIPYFDNNCKAFIHYKSRLVDYPTLPQDCFEHEICSERRQITIDMRDVLPLATGREAWGKYIWLNVRDGEITVEERLMHDLPQIDLKVFFDGLKQDYVTLKLIPCHGRITIEADKIKERPGGEIITQLYQGFGWLLAFRRDEAFDAVDQLMDKLAEHRNEWEPTEEDWDDDDHWC
ncbi:hypothetical protein NOF04DRAFT_1370611 [Fusarium oxysporum II5]|nr:hypothetical protein NOF04DRAFT_1370611 [Fusarium oxysporum II5]